MHKSIASLQYLTMDLPSFPHVKQVQMACEAGLSWIQLRMKLPPYEEQLQIAVEARKITADYGCILIVNDQVTIARDAGADGVHLGNDDMHWEEARKVLGNDALVGISTHSWMELDSYRNARVQYAGLGPFSFTRTKEKLDWWPACTCPTASSSTGSARNMRGASSRCSPSWRASRCAWS